MVGDSNISYKNLRSKRRQGEVPCGEDHGKRECVEDMFVEKNDASTECRPQPIFFSNLS